MADRTSDGSERADGCMYMKSQNYKCYFEDGNKVCENVVEEMRKCPGKRVERKDRSGRWVEGSEDSLPIPSFGFDLDKIRTKMFDLDGFLSGKDLFGGENEKSSSAPDFFKNPQRMMPGPKPRDPEGDKRSGFSFFGSSEVNPGYLFDNMRKQAKELKGKTSAGSSNHQSTVRRGKVIDEI
eukprot:CAMPEP_0170167550 /NCGR_PEP_ID=MMETSP0040_2-20121228/935_1 /TAXON_ID=641309 /ORGANISM="Lotharella oceanica, Strain CCMP622" /LENGTH=180 /DNA_ID=CAMNT_0010405625 /DNA_START=17 /DNA_END=559 /DNA_ORIENTATION=+